VRLPEIAVAEKPTDHVRRDLAGALRINLVPGRELKTAIGASQRSFETSMEKAVGVDYGDTGSAAVRIAIGQPEEGHRSSLSQVQRLAPRQHFSHRDAGQTVDLRAPEPSTGDPNVTMAVRKGQMKAIIAGTAPATTLAAPLPRLSNQSYTARNFERGGRVVMTARNIGES
jgi:hypothetical protein